MPIGINSFLEPRLFKTMTYKCGVQGKGTMELFLSGNSKDNKKNIKNTDMIPFYETKARNENRKKKRKRWTEHFRQL